MRRCSPRSKPAVQTRLPTFSITSRSIRSRSRPPTAEAIMLASRWQAPSVLICTTGRPRASIRWASIEPAMSPSMTAGRRPAAELGQQGLQEGRLAAARRAHDVDAKHAGGVEAGAVLGGQLLVGLQNALGGDDFHGTSSSSMLCRNNCRPSSMVISRALAAGTLDHQLVDLLAGAAGAGSSKPPAAGRCPPWPPRPRCPGPSSSKAKRRESQCTPESRPIASSSRVTRPCLPGAADLPPNLFDQGLDDGQLVHGAGRAGGKGSTRAVTRHDPLYHSGSAGRHAAADGRPASP